MKNSKTVFHELVASIYLREDTGEINSIAYMLLESLLGMTKTDIMAGKSVSLPDSVVHDLQVAVERINDGEPVQYVLGEAYFYGRKFYVNPSVLIPRPETEELILVVLSYFRSHRMRPLKILDIGTGSGCIPITLNLELDNAEIYASDISKAALSVAASNALTHGAKITFFEHDILKQDIPVPQLDVLISNPPYITDKEKRLMKTNVLDHEPHLALFVPDNDPLIFYKEIARQAKSVLKHGGLLAVEINENFGDEVSQLFVRCDFKEVTVVTDVASKARIVKGFKA